jgi:hypothetical protein
VSDEAVSPDSCVLSAESALSVVAAVVSSPPVVGVLPPPPQAIRERVITDASKTETNFFLIKKNTSYKRIFYIPFCCKT